MSEPKSACELCVYGVWGMDYECSYYCQRDDVTYRNSHIPMMCTKMKPNMKGKLNFLVFDIKDRVRAHLLCWAWKGEAKLHKLGKKLYHDPIEHGVHRCEKMCYIAPTVEIRRVPLTGNGKLQGWYWFENGEHDPHDMDWFLYCPYCGDNLERDCK